jgi:hypothetical protein
MGILRPRTRIVGFMDLDSLMVADGSDDETTPPVRLCVLEEMNVYRR